MRKFAVAILTAVIIFTSGMFAMASTTTTAYKSNSTTCSSTTSCLPNIRMVPSAEDSTVYRVRFVEIVGAERRNWTAGPWFSLDGATRAAERLADASGVVDSSIKIQVNASNSWVVYAQ